MSTISRVALFASVGAIAISSTAQARAIHVVRFKVDGATHALATHAPNIQITSVRVNGHLLTIGDPASNGDAFMYGEGVVLRFHQHGSRQYVRAASAANGPRRAAIRFYVYRNPK